MVLSVTKYQSALYIQKFWWTYLLCGRQCLWTGILLNRFRVYTANVAKVSLLVSILAFEWWLQYSFVLFCMIYLLALQSLSYQYLKHADPSLKKQWIVASFHLDTPQGRLLVEAAKILFSRSSMSYIGGPKIRCSQSLLCIYIFFFFLILVVGCIFTLKHQSLNTFLPLTIGCGLLVWCQASLINALFNDTSFKKYI